MSAHRFSSAFKLLGSFALMASTTALGQEAPVPPPSPNQAAPPVQIEYDKQPLPSNPDAAFDLVRKANGLGSDLLKPWYLKAHYQGFDAYGKPSSQGTFTVLWAAKDDYHVSYASDGFHLEYYRTADGAFRVGSSERIPYVESMLWRAIMYPLQVPHFKAKLKQEGRKIGQISLDCLKYDLAAGPETSYCVDKQQLELRTSQQQGIGSTYNKISIFQHHFLAGEIHVSDYGQPVLNITIDELRSLRDNEVAMIAPPASATKAEKLIDQGEADSAIAAPGSVTAGETISKVPPIYPREAKARRVQGTVRLTGTIMKDGSISNLVIVRDPDPALSAAAMEAVSHWRYRPYLLKGQPVEVDTVITVNFTLGG